MDHLTTRLLSESSSSEEGDDHHYKTYGIMLLLLMLIFYINVGLFMEKMEFRFGHETGVIIVFGIGVSFLIKYIKEDFVKQLEFDKGIFFEVLLPLIIFATGYNMRRQQFFQNFSNISKFGLLGTFLTFIMYSLLTMLVFEHMEIKKSCPDPSKCGGNDYGVMNMMPQDIFYVCSILCSSDIIAAVTIIKFDEQPKLFSIILGEGLFNDAVAIILY